MDLMKFGKNILWRSTIMVLLSVVMLCEPVSVKAFPLDTYASSSVLAEGNWVKISVSQSGMHLITVSDLKSWGFSDPSKVRVYGYGGERLPDRLTESTYIDDLPAVPSVVTTRGLMFYAKGPVAWSYDGVRYIHSLNPYSTVGYYFLSDREADGFNMETVGDVPSDASSLSTTFIERKYHEQELVSLGETGHLLVGEDFKYNSSQNFAFDLTDNAGNEVWMRCSFVTKTHSSSSLLFAVNGKQLPASPSDIIRASANNTYTHGTEGIIEKNLEMTGDKLTLGITHKSSVTVHQARLNYITVNYTRKLKLTDGKLDFRSSDPNGVALSSATGSTHVWDVTDPLNVKSLKTECVDGVLRFRNVYTGEREYAAWNENAAFPSPAYAGKVANQDLHAVPVPDMVIFTIGQWRDQAERIAQLHRNSSDSLNVLVVDQNDVFNEFASGCADANAFRKMLKMYWDRGNESRENQLRYALFFGRGIFDNRRIAAITKDLTYPTMPIWQTDGGLSDNDTFSTDDMFAFLQDESGGSVNSDRMVIAIGRMPVRTEEEAKTSVDKLYKYVNSSPADSWKNQFLFVADDDDNGAHMTQTESMCSNLMASPSGKEFFYNKLYVDAYKKTNNQFPEATERMMKILGDGVMWWNYIGHANTVSWGHEGFMTYTDISNLYLKRLPVLYAATCEFMRWDASSVSGAEVMFLNPNGGVIAAISAVRPVYISDNGVLSSYISSIALTRDENGEFLPLGEILRRAKVKFTTSNSNKLRYALMGDPAMRFVAPSNVAVLETIDGKDVTAENQLTLMARQNATLKGSVYDAKGNKMTGFNGFVEAKMYDAEKSVTTLGQGDNGKSVVFEEQGGQLYAVRDSVVNGEFTLNVAMPSEIASNFRPAALNMFVTNNEGVEAVGCSRDFYVYGYDENAPSDTVAPVIECYYINHETFVSGDCVNESPMVIARVSDNVGINLSSAGIGHQITLTLDGVKNYDGVSQYYTPDTNGSPSGVIAYPVSELAEGQHTLRLRVWDTSGNASESTIEFVVQPGLAPVIYDVYSDANPASTEANFYISHNRPDAMISVTVEVYNLLGKRLWSATQSGRSDMFTTFPITWNLTDDAGRRVQRGIYLYKASVTTDDEHYTTESKRIAVTAR